jgi:hypothetical protein
MSWRHMGRGGIAPPVLTSELDGGERSASRPSRFTVGEIAPGSHWIGDWMGPRAGLDVMEKIKVSYSCRKSNPGRPASSPSLYRLSYSGSVFLEGRKRLENSRCPGQHLNRASSEFIPLNFHLRSTDTISDFNRLEREAYHPRLSTAQL